MEVVNSKQTAYTVSADHFFQFAFVMDCYVFMIKGGKQQDPLPLPHALLKKALTLIICYFAGGSLPFELKGVIYLFA